MRIGYVLVVALVLVILTVPPVNAQDIVENASQISVTVPTIGSAPLGTTESMSQFQMWLNDITNALLSLINQVTDLLGISNTDYVNNMQQTIDQGLQQANMTRKP